MKAFYTYLLSFLSLVTISCRENDITPVKVTRLGQTLQNYEALDSIQQSKVLDSLQIQFNALAMAMGRDKATAEFLTQYSESQAMKVFQPDVEKEFPDLNNLEFELGNIQASAKKHNFPIPQILYATISWGKPQPLLRVGNVLLIALNHYLGSDYPGYSHWHEYLRITKAREFIQYDIAAALSATQSPFTTKDSPTLLNWMLYEGALVEARMSLCYEPRLNLALGYTTAQLEWVEDHTQELWQELILNKNVYSTDPDIIDRYIVSAPASPLANGMAPGRIGRYIGYKILKEYKKKQGEKNLSFFLSPEFYDSKTVIADSGF